MLSSESSSDHKIKRSLSKTEFVEGKFDNVVFVGSTDFEKFRHGPTRYFQGDVPMRSECDNTIR